MDTIRLYYIFILHQTTTETFLRQNSPIVVLYLHSTSNHNSQSSKYNGERVVLYLHSTSNHNMIIVRIILIPVVLYLHSTSNHNCFLSGSNWEQLYYIFILHQTTTPRAKIGDATWLYYIFILHQTTTTRTTRRTR